MCGEGNSCVLDGTEQRCSCCPTEETGLSWPPLVVPCWAPCTHFSQVTFSCPQSLKGVNGRGWCKNHLGLPPSPCAHPASPQHPLSAGCKPRFKSAFPQQQGPSKDQTFGNHSSLVAVFVIPILVFKTACFCVRSANSYFLPTRPVVDVI